MVDNVGILGSCIGGGPFDHVVIFLQVGELSLKPPDPFKFNYFLLSDPEFREMAYSECKYDDSLRGDSTMFEFKDNLKTIKKKTMAWEKPKYNDSQEQIWILEKDIENIFKLNLNGILVRKNWKN
jgi:hypothetical protein